MTSCAIKPEDSPSASALYSEKSTESNNLFSVYEIYTQNGEKKLYGKYYVPNADKNEYPVIIMSHGYLMSHSFFDLYAENAAKAGISVYAFDFSGGTIKNNSDGKFLEMTPLTELSDLNAVIDNVKSFEKTDVNNVYLLGHSLGGLVSAKAANDRHGEIKALFLIAPAFLLCNAKSLGVDLFTDKFINDAETLKLYDDFTAFTEPVYIFQGTADSLVAPNYANEAAAAYENAELFTFTGEEHFFTDDAVNKVSKTMVDVILN